MGKHYTPSQLAGGMSRQLVGWRSQVGACRFNKSCAGSQACRNADNQKSSVCATNTSHAYVPRPRSCAHVTTYSCGSCAASCRSSCTLVQAAHRPLAHARPSAFHMVNCVAGAQSHFPFLGVFSPHQPPTSLSLSSPITINTVIIYTRQSSAIPISSTVMIITTTPHDTCHRHRPQRLLT